MMLRQPAQIAAGLCKTLGIFIPAEYISCTPSALRAFDQYLPGYKVIDITYGCMRRIQPIFAAFCIIRRIKYGKYVIVYGIPSVIKIFYAVVGVVR